MSTGLLFIIIGIIIVVILSFNNHFSSHKFVKETEPYFMFLMEDDYKFLLSMRYGDVDVEKLFGQRVRNGILTIIIPIIINNKPVLIIPPPHLHYNIFHQIR